MQQEASRAAVGTEQLTQFAAMLREQQTFREEQIRDLATAPAAESDAEAEVLAILRRSAVTALAEIEAALVRIERGTYGLCTACGVDIRIERLEVVPQTARCIACERRR